MSGRQLVVGIDIGGSKTHGILVGVDDGATVAEAFGGAGNIVSVGEQETRRQLGALLTDLLTGTPLDDVRAVAVGAAGIEAPQDHARMTGLLRRLLPGVPLIVVRDVQLLLAAAGLTEGVVAVSGTGSAAWGVTADGREARAGGWGYLLGDDGAAYGLIRSALRHVLARADAGDTPDALTHELFREAGVDSAHALLGAFYATPSRRIWAHRVTAVYKLAESGDEACSRLVAGAAADLVAMIEPVCRRLELTGPVVLAGGMAVHQPMLQQAVREGLTACGVVDVQVLAVDPVHGAVALARAAAGPAGTV